MILVIWTCIHANGSILSGYSFLFTQTQRTQTPFIYLFPNNVTLYLSSPIGTLGIGIWVGLLCFKWCLSLIYLVCYQSLFYDEHISYIHPKGRIQYNWLIGENIVWMIWLIDRWFLRIKVDWDWFRIDKWCFRFRRLICVWWYKGFLV